MSKKIIIGIILAVVIIGGITTFTLLNGKDGDLKESNESSNETSNVMQDDKTDSNDNSNTNSNEVTRIKLTFNNEEVYVRLNDSKSSKDFINMLPLTLDFEDYNSTEKIATLPRKLTTEDAPSGYTPHTGDFSYYAPWGNLSIFYKEFRYSNSLVKLGEFESGIEKLQNLNSDFKMTIEIAE